MSYPKTLGELWDMGTEAAEAWEQAQWLLVTVREFDALTQNPRFTSERSPSRVREMVQEVLDACQADY